MKVLIVEPDIGISTKLAESLRSAGHDACTAVSATAAKAVFAVKPFHLIMIGSRSVDAPLLDLVRCVRDRDQAHKAYVLTIISDASDDHLSQVYDAGADAHLRGHVSAPLVLARLRAVERLLHRYGVVSIVSAAAPPTPRAPAIASDPIDACARSNAWCGARATIEQAATQMLQRPVMWRDIRSAVQPFQYTTRISLISARTNVELRIALGVDAASASALVTQLFGDTSDELAADMLGELNNLFMGALKSGFNSEEFAFTAGLPQAINASEVLQPDAAYVHQLAFSLVAGEATLAVHLALCAKVNESMIHSRLREGMVLGQDLLNQHGLLLLSRGTRLSQTMLDRLGNMLPPNRTVDILAP